MNFNTQLQPLPAILVDLDGTVFDNTHRAHLVPPRDQWRDPAAWADYEAACIGDVAVQPVIELVKSLHSTGRYNIAFCTARFARNSWSTLQQLRAYDLDFTSAQILIMRPNDSQLTPGEFKVEAVKQLAEMGVYVCIAIDDSDDVVANLEAIGVTTLQPASRCAAVKIENEDGNQALKEEQSAHRQTKEKLSVALMRNSEQAGELERVRKELAGLRR